MSAHGASCHAEASLAGVSRSGEPREAATACQHEENSPSETPCSEAGDGETAAALLTKLVLPGENAESGIPCLPMTDCAEKGVSLPLGRRISFRALAKLQQLLRRPLKGTSGKVLALALPSVGEQVLNMFVGLANTWMVGHLGASSLAAVGLADQVVMLISSFFVAVSTGSTALIARCTGARDADRSCRTLQQSTLVALAVGLFCTAFGVPLARQAMVWLGAAEDVVALGADYLRIASFSYALMALMFVGNGALRGAGDTRTPLVIMSIINVVNVVVGYSLLNGLGPLPTLGVRGVAIGAATARSLGCAMVLALLIHGRAGLKLRIGRPSLDWPIIARLLDIGLPAGAEQVLMRLGQTAFATIVASLGTAAYAAHQIAMTSSSIGFMPGFGFGVAATTLVGQALGARDPKGAEMACRTAQRLCMIMMGAIGLLIVIFARQLTGFFINDPEVIGAGLIALRILGFIQPATAWMMVISGGLRGAGDTRWTLIITAASVWLVRIPAGRLLGLTLGLGLAGIWIAAGIDMLSRALLYDWRFRTGKWKNIRA